MRIGSIGIIPFIFGLAVAQQGTQKQPAQPPPSQSKPAEAKPAQSQPAPLFGGTLGIRSSRRTKESTTLGFNGIDPSGKVDKQMLATPVKPEHRAKVQNMAAARPAPGDVNAFAKEGKLKTP